MYNSASRFLATCILFAQVTGAPLFAQEASTTADEGVIQQKANFTPFTGQVTRDRVRMRLQPTLESPVIRELDRGDLLVVVNEVDDFYAVSPPTDMKAFIYRTYVL